MSLAATPTAPAQPAGLPPVVVTYTELHKGSSKVTQPQVSAAAATEERRTTNP